MTVACDKLVYEGSLFLECRESGEKVDLYEAAYLTMKGQVEVQDREGRRLGWIDLIIEASSHEPHSWVMFTVYYDLRERGRVLKLGPLTNAFTLYKSGSPRSIVMVLEETRLFPVEDIVEWIETARRLSRELVLAIVDKHGDVSYYVVERFKPPTPEGGG